MIESATASGTPEASRKAPGDLAGLVTTAGASGTVAAALAASLADYLALIDEMRTASIPTELPTMTVSIDGSHRKPELIGATTDIADGAWNSAGDSIVLRIPAAATIQTARWIVSKLSDSASAATDIGAALAASGWTPDLIVASRSGVRARGPGVVPTSYPSVVYGPTGSDVYVASRAGIVCLLDEKVSLLATGPRIAGHEVSVFRSGIFVAGAGAVHKVAGTTTRARRAGS